MVGASHGCALALLTGPTTVKFLHGHRRCVGPSEGIGVARVVYGGVDQQRHVWIAIKVDGQGLKGNVLVTQLARKVHIWVKVVTQDHAAALSTACGA